MAEGLLIIRLGLGLLLFAHGTQKLFGWYGGHGLQGTGGFFESLGFKPGRQMAMVAGLSEAGGGVLLALGLLTPLGSAMVIGTMLVASMSVHRPHGLWATNGGYELPMTYALIAAGFAFTGAGPWSIDNALDIPVTRGWGAGLAALLVALVAAMLTEGRRRRTADDASDADTYPAEPVAADPSVADADAAATVDEGADINR
jgi:putative oxidoreductase